MGANVVTVPVAVALKPAPLAVTVHPPLLPAKTRPDSPLKLHTVRSLDL